MDLFDAIRAYHPCQQFSTKPVPDDKLRSVLSAARLAWSQNNLQPWRFVVVRDDERKRKLAQAFGRGRVIAEAPVVIVAFSVEEDIPVTVGGYISAYPLDVAVAVNQLLLAATAEGLGSAWIVDFHEEKVRRALNVPEGVHPIAVVPIGYAAEANNGGNGSAHAEGRKSPNEIIAYNEYAW
jgi:nitroreductase